MDTGVIAVANQKGGVGKTTVAMNMAAGLIRRRGSCIVIDSDPQGSATLWTELSGDPSRFPVEVVLAEDKLNKQIARLQTSLIT